MCSSDKKVPLPYPVPKGKVLYHGIVSDCFLMLRPDDMAGKAIPEKSFHNQYGSDYRE